MNKYQKQLEQALKSSRVVVDARDVDDHLDLLAFGNRVDGEERAALVVGSIQVDVRHGDRDADFPRGNRLRQWLLGRGEGDSDWKEARRREDFVE